MRRLKVAAAFAACLGFVLAAQAREQKKKPYPHKILAEIATGKVPSAVALSPDERVLLVSNLRGKSLTIIDPRSLKVTGTVEGLDGPLGSVLSSDGSLAYVCESGGSTVAVVSMDDSKILARIKVGKNPSFAALSPDGKWLYVTNNRSNDLSVVDTAKRTEHKRISVPDRPLEISVDGTGKRALVACGGVQTISIINLETLEEAARVKKPIAVLSDIQYGPDGKRFYAPGVYGELYIFDAASLKVEKVLSVQNEPYGIAVDPKGTFAYVSNYHAGTISVVNTSTETVLGKIDVGRGAGLMALSRDGSRIYICVEDKNRVLVIEVPSPDGE